MAKIKNEEKVEEVIEEKVEVVPKEVEVEGDKPKKIEYPEGDAKGRFHTVAFEGGYVVYNPAGQRATGVIGKIKADDIVRQSNQAAQIKG